MAELEQLELDAHREQLNKDVRGLIDKYRAIFGWDVPGIDERLADRLILGAIRQALDSIEHASTGPTGP